MQEQQRKLREMRRTRGVAPDLQKWFMNARRQRMLREVKAEFERKSKETAMKERIEKEREEHLRELNKLMLLEKEKSAKSMDNIKKQFDDLLIEKKRQSNTQLNLIQSLSKQQRSTFFKKLDKIINGHLNLNSLDLIHAASNDKDNDMLRVLRMKNKVLNQLDSIKL
ncbi:hypothetical protein QTN25_006764 [Entamoeba marina]